MAETQQKHDPTELGARQDVVVVPAFDEMAVRPIIWQCPDPDPSNTNRTEITDRTFNYDPDWDK